MLSLTLNGDNLEIKFETQVGDKQFKGIVSVFSKLHGAFYHNEEYKWVIPKKHIDIIVEHFEDMIAWNTSIEQIKGESDAIIPEFEVSLDGLEDLKLKPYPFQTVGISFLTQIKKGLIADEMGLGKSLQSIGAVHKLNKTGEINKALVICPTSLKYQWSNEIEKFTDHSSIVIDGTPKKRKEALANAMESDILFTIINYELVRNDLEIIKSMNFDAIICDEVHRIKNWQSQTSIAIKSIDAPYKFGLTGTPMQNKPDELYNVYDWLNPLILGNFWAFRNRYVVTTTKFGKQNVVIGYKRQGELRKRISPYMLRRMKADVAPELPEMIFNTYRVNMTKEQEKLYMAFKEDSDELMKEITEFRLSNLKPAEDEIIDTDEQGFTKEPEHPKESQVLGYINLMISASDHPELLRLSDSGMSKKYLDLLDKESKSPKLDELDSILKEQLQSGNKKIVIFTQFARMQKLIVERISKLGGVEILNGSMKPFERQAAVDRFKYDDKINFFVSTDAGNYGINLQFSNVLIHFDLPWNPATKDQRDGRVHRIGSSHSEVHIIHLVTSGSIDESIEKTLINKKNLANQLVEKSQKERSMMNQLMKSLIKKDV
ncbi:helicase [Bacillus phage vB_BauM_KLEB27-3]|nr:helicase [Bacillus phage vB_BauM_KLEB27-3]